MKIKKSLYVLAAMMCIQGSLLAWTKWEKVLVYPQHFISQSQHTVRTIFDDQNISYACFLLFTGAQSIYCGAHALACINTTLQTNNVRACWLQTASLGCVGILCVAYAPYALSLATTLIARTVQDATTKSSE